MSITRWPARMSAEQKMTSLGISIDDLDRFCSIYIKIWSQYLKQTPEGDWFQVNSKKGPPIPLTKQIVLSHLIHRFWISTFASRYSTYICFDLDPHRHQELNYEIIKQWVKYPMVFRSSLRGGLHVYGHLDFPIDVEKLSYITEVTCKDLGINVSPGICEIFPHPRKALRLPMGKGCAILHPNSLTPICDDVAMGIRYISKNLRYHSFQDLFSHITRRIYERNKLQETC